MPRKSNAAKSDRSKRFRILGDENRLRLLEALFAGPQNVTSLATDLGLEQSLTSHHLASLKEAGLASSYRDGKEVFYRLADGVRKAGAAKQLDLGCCCITLNGHGRSAPRP